MLKELFLSFVILFSVYVTDVSSQNINDFNGSWFGEVEVVYSTQIPAIKENKAKIKLVIYKNNVELYTYQSNLNARGKYLTSWKEFMKDKLVITRYKSNVVITGIESGSDTNGNWIDSLSIQLVRIDRKYAAVNFSKQVNNIGVGQMNVFGIGKLEVVNNTNR